MSDGKLINNLINIVKLILLILIILIIIFLITGIIIFITYTFPQDNKYFSRDKITKDIIMVISAGADVGVIQNVYDKRKNERFVKIKMLINDKKDKYYPYDTSLMQILMDIKTIYYIEKKAKYSADFLDKLNNVIKEYNELSPFDLLDYNEKYYFENIKKISGNNYPKIKDDLKRIYTELNIKNILLDKYKSKIKWLSIFLIIISFISAAVFILFIFSIVRHKKNKHENTTL